MIDAYKYVSDNPELLLTNEYERPFRYKPKTMEALLMRISSILWDLVDFPSGKDCPRCKEGGLSYVIAEPAESENRKIALDCDNCGYLENLDGTEWSDGYATIYPVNKNDLKALGLDLNSVEAQHHRA